MKTKLLEGLKTKYEGIQDSVLSRIADKLAKTVTTEDQIATAIEGVTLQNVIDSYADSRATEATNTAIVNYEKKHNIKEGKPVAAEPPKPANPPATPPGDEPPAWAKALIDQNKTLAEKLQAIEGGKVTNDRIAKLRAELTGAPDKLLGRFEKDMPKDLTDDEFQAWLTEVKTDVEPIITAIVQKGVIFNPPATGGAGTPPAEPSKEVQERIAERSAGANEVAVKGLPK